MAWYCRLAVLPSVRVSVCLSVTKCIVSLRVSVGAESSTGVFLGEGTFYSSLQTLHIVAGCIAFSRNTEQKTNRRHFRVCNSHGQRGYVTMAIPFAAFFRRFCPAAIPYTSYAVRSAFLATTAKLLVNFFQWALSSKFATKFWNAVMVEDATAPVTRRFTYLWILVSGTQ